MTTTTPKEGRLNIRCDHRTRELLDRAATYARVSVSEFVLNHAIASAEQVIQAHESITLGVEAFQAFLAALDSPAPPNAGAEARLQAAHRAGSLGGLPYPAAG